MFRNREYFSINAMLLALVIGLASSSAIAQGLRYGVGAAFGVRHAKMHSNFDRLNNVGLLQEGGSVFIMAGHRMVMAKVTGGFFSSASSAPSTDLFEGSLALDVNILGAFRDGHTRFTPYITGALGVDKQKFYGFYATSDATRRNFSVSVEPYVGSSIQWAADAGAGFRYEVPGAGEFLQFFAEARKEFVLRGNSSEILSDTQLDSGLSVNVGLAFGFNR